MFSGSLRDYYASLGSTKSATRPTQNTAPTGQGAIRVTTPPQQIQAAQGMPGQALGAISDPSTWSFPQSGQVQGLDTTYNPYGGGSTGSYSTGTAQPDTGALQNTARSLISSIQNAYHSLTGQLTPVIQDKVNQYLQNYDTQTNDLNKTYGNSIGQTQNLYGARGLQDSSFLGNALDDNTSTYNQNIDALNQDKSQKLGAIGQYAQGLQSSANSAAAQYGQYLPNLGQYSASDLQSLNSSLQGSLPGIQSQVAGMGTNQDFLNTLNQYAPQANQGSSQLTGKLQQLVTSSAPIFAKKQIAAGLIKSSQLTDPAAQNYYQDYFQKLLNGG